MTAGSCPISVCGKTTPIFTMALRRLTRRSLPAGPAPVDDEAPPSYKGARPTGPRTRQLERGQAMKQVDPLAHHRRRLGRPHPAPEVPVGRAHRLGVEPAVAP